MIVKTSDVLLPDCAILLDVDGVMVDWATACFEACGVSQAEGYARWPAGSFEIMEALGITEEQMWEKIEARGSHFWEFLEEYPWARKLWDHCNTIAPTYFMTSPSNDPQCHVGKTRWMQTFTGNRKFRNYLMGPAKQLCARPNNLLIDDYDRNVNNFKAAGGSTVLFPQYWNANNDKKDDPLPYTFEQIELWVQAQFQRKADEAAGK